MQPPRVLPAFALAKIQPPSPRTVLIERPALERALDAALRRHRLTLLVAPAGYGKTAALARQIRRLPEGCALAWLSADEDDHLQRFLACLSTALERYDLPWRVAPEALGTLAQAERGLRDVAAEIVNALASAEVERGLIVVDDAHRLTDPQVFELLQAMLERLPDHWGVAIASRVDPPLALPRWRARGELAEFRQYDLRFDESEVHALLTANGATLSPEAERQLLERTQGWAVGLRLHLSARPGGSTRAAPAQRHLFDYLASEVLDDMPADLRRFLLRCSVLPELTAARCEHVARIPHAARLLKEVEQRGLFVATLDADELTLRLHDLFRDFLEDRLQRDFPQELPYLLRRAADEEPDLTRAVGYLTRAGDWERAARVLAERGPMLVAAGGAPALEQMLALFPQAEFERRPDLHFLRGLTTFPRFDFDGMVDAMRRAAEIYAREGRSREAALAHAYACVAMLSIGQLDAAARELQELFAQPLDPELRSLVCFGCAWAAYAQMRAHDVAPMLAGMVDALERIEDVHVWDRCFFTSLLTGLPGVVPVLERFAAGALRRAGETPSQLRAGALHVRAWLAFSAGRLDEAMQHLARADEDVRWLGRPRSLMTENWMTHTLFDAVRGDRAASYAAAEENKRDLVEHSLPSNRLTHQYEETFTHLRASWLLGDAATLRRLAIDLEGTANAYEWPAAHDDRRCARAMVAILDGRLAQARPLLAAVAAAGERSCFFPSTQARLLWADVELQLRHPATAADVLRPWLEAAHRGGEIGGAFLAGRPVLRRLAGHAWGKLLSEADQQLLAGLLARMSPARTAPDAAAAAVVNGSASRTWGASSAPADPVLAALSEREREVLARIAAGDSNKLIARAFELSPHTVKRHVANILGKLGVTTRGQAAARWRQDASD